jgi:hypothetical protein
VFVEDHATPPRDEYELLLGPYAILVLLTSPAPPQTRLAEQPERPTKLHFATLLAHTRPISMNSSYATRTMYPLFTRVCGSGFLEDSCRGQRGL